MSDEPKKLHEYRVPFSAEELEKAAELLANNLSVSAISEKMGLTWGRTKTLVGKLEVMEAAHKLRTTSLVPDQLKSITGLLTQVVAGLEVVETRQCELEAQMRRMTRTMWNRNIQINKQKETIKELRKRERDLRNLIRSRGIV